MQEVPVTHELEVTEPQKGETHRRIAEYDFSQVDFTKARGAPVHCTRYPDTLVVSPQTSERGASRVTNHGKDIHSPPLLFVLERKLMAVVIFTDYVEWDGGRQLPTFKGYTVDVRLRHFRKLGFNQPYAFIAFNTEQGDAMLAELVSVTPTDSELFAELTELFLPDY